MLNNQLTYLQNLVPGRDAYVIEPIGQLCQIDYSRLALFGQMHSLAAYAVAIVKNYLGVLLPSWYRYLVTGRVWVK